MTLLKHSRPLCSLASWRRSSRSHWTRGIALGIIVSFTLPYLTWAFEPGNYSLKHSGVSEISHLGKLITIPGKLGVAGKGFSGGVKTIVHIQDLHCNYEAQKNIAGLIDYLAREHGLRLVGEEGAFATVNLTKLKTFPLPEIRLAVSDHFVREGKLSGVEYYSINAPNEIRLEGIETPELYQHNFDLIRTFLNGESQGYCLDLRAALAELKPGIYSPRLREFDAKSVAYRDGALELLRYASFLQASARRNRVDLSRCANLKRFLNRRQNYFGPDVDPDSLYRELEQADAAVREALYRSDDERRLDNLLHRLNIAERLLNISATPAEVAEFRARRAEFAVRPFADFIRAHGGEEDCGADPELYQLNRYLDATAEFYRLADERSVKFVDNLVRKMDCCGQDLAVMLTGGFHTEGILAELQRRNIACVSVTPRLTRQDIVNPYFSLLQNKRTPLEKLLARNQNIIALRSRGADGNFEPGQIVRTADMNREEERVFARRSEMLLTELAVWVQRKAGKSVREIQTTLKAVADRYPAAEFIRDSLGESLVSLNETVARKWGDIKCVVVPTGLKDAEQQDLLALVDADEPPSSAREHDVFEEIALDGARVRLDGWARIETMLAEKTHARFSYLAAFSALAEAVKTRIGRLTAPARRREAALRDGTSGQSGSVRAVVSRSIQAVSAGTDAHPEMGRIVILKGKYDSSLLPHMLAAGGVVYQGEQPELRREMDKNAIPNLQLTPGDPWPALLKWNAEAGMTVTLDTRNGKVYQGFPEKAEHARDDEAKTLSALRKMDIEISGSKHASPAELAQVKTALDLLPEAHLQPLRKIAYTKFLRACGTVLARIPRVNRNIYVLGQNPLGPAEAVIHELGHVLENQRSRELSGFRTLSWRGIAHMLKDRFPVAAAALALLAAAGYAAFALDNGPLFIASLMMLGAPWLQRLLASEFHAAKSGSAFVSGYSRVSPSEDLAETYRMYVLHGAEFRHLARVQSRLKEKYLWMRDTLFDGWEYDRDAEDHVIRLPKALEVRRAAAEKHEASGADQAEAEAEAEKVLLDSAVQRTDRLGPKLKLSWKPYIVTLHQLPLELRKIYHRVVALRIAALEENGYSYALGAIQRTTLNNSPDYIIDEIIKNAFDAQLLAQRPEDPVDLHIAVKGDRLVIEVSDNGVGVKSVSNDGEEGGALEVEANVQKSRAAGTQGAEGQPSVADSADRWRIRGGSRVGLMWSQLLAEMHGGRLEFLENAKPGFRTTVRVTLPMKEMGEININTDRAEPKNEHAADDGQGLGGIAPWLRENIAAWSGGRISARAYDRYLAWLVENGASLAGGAVLAAGLGALALVMGNPFVLQQFPQAAFLSAQPLFVALHFLRDSQGRRAPPANIAIAVVLAAINILLLTLPLGWAVLIPASFLSHGVVNALLPGLTDSLVAKTEAGTVAGRLAARGEKAAAAQLAEVLSGIPARELPDLQAVGVFEMQESPVPGRKAYLIELSTAEEFRPRAKAVMVFSRWGRPERFYVSGLEDFRGGEGAAHPDAASQRFVELDPALVTSPRLQTAAETLRARLRTMAPKAGTLRAAVQRTLDLRGTSLAERNWQVVRSLSAADTRAFLEAPDNAAAAWLLRRPEADGLGVSPRLFLLRAAHLGEECGASYNAEQGVYYAADDPMFSFSHEAVHHVFANLLDAEVKLKDGRTEDPALPEMAAKLKRLREHFYSGEHEQLLWDVLRGYPEIGSGWGVSPGEDWHGHPGVNRLLNEVLAYTFQALAEGRPYAYGKNRVTREDAELFKELEFLPEEFNASHLPSVPKSDSSRTDLLSELAGEASNIFAANLREQRRAENRISPSDRAELTGRAYANLYYQLTGELKKLPADTTPVVAIEGMPGTGKTTFADQYAEYLRRWGVDARVLHMDDYLRGGLPLIGAQVFAFVLMWTPGVERLPRGFIQGLVIALLFGKKQTQRLLDDLEACRRGADGGARVVVMEGVYASLFADRLEAGNGFSPYRINAAADLKKVQTRYLAREKKTTESWLKWFTLRLVPPQKAYAFFLRPYAAFDAVLDLNDFQAPRLIQTQPGPEAETLRDEFCMQAALRQAGRAARERRNPFSARVGAVFARDGRIGAADCNHSGSLHAEQYAIVAALSTAVNGSALDPERKAKLKGRLQEILKWSVKPRDDALVGEVGDALLAVDRELGGRSLADMTLYVTLEPCDACAELLARLGVERVVWAQDAVNPKHRGTEVLRTAGVKTTPGVAARSAWLDNAGYLLLNRVFHDGYDRAQRETRNYRRFRTAPRDAERKTDARTESTRSQETLDRDAVRRMIEGFYGPEGKYRFSPPDLNLGKPFSPEALGQLGKVFGDLKSFENVLSLMKPEYCHITVVRTLKGLEGVRLENDLPQEKIPAAQIDRLAQEARETLAGQDAFSGKLAGKLKLMPDGAIILEVADPELVAGVKALRGAFGEDWGRPGMVHLTLGRLRTADVDDETVEKIRAVLDKHNRAQTLNARLDVKAVRFGQFGRQEVTDVTVRTIELGSSYALTTLVKGRASAEEMAEYSLLKLGKKSVVEKIAAELARAITAETGLTPKNEEQVRKEWVIVCPGGNLSRASSLLARAVSRLTGIPVTYAEISIPDKNANYQYQDYSGVSDDTIRRRIVAERLNLARPAAVRDKNVIFIDDSIVSGTVLKVVEEMLARAGAKKVRGFFAARLDGQGDHAFESKVNYQALAEDGLATLITLLREEKEYTNRLLVAVIDLPLEQFSALLEKIGDEERLRLFLSLILLDVSYKEKSNIEKFNALAEWVGVKAGLTVPGNARFDRLDYPAYETRVMGLLERFKRTLSETDAAALARETGAILAEAMGARIGRAENEAGKLDGRQSERENIARRMDEDEAEALSARVVEALELKRLKDIDGEKIITGTEYGYDRHVEKSEKDFAEGVPGYKEVYIRVGYLFFFDPAAFEKLPADLKNDLGSNVVFIPNLNDRNASLNDRNFNVFSYATVMAMFKCDLAGTSVVDCGAGDGSLALAALKLGATEVQLVDYERGLLDRAKGNLQSNGYREGRDFRLVQGDLTRPEEVLAHLGGTEKTRVIVSNIGNHLTFYSITNQNSMKLIKGLGTVAYFIGGGYYLHANQKRYENLKRTDEKRLGEYGFEVEADSVKIENRQPNPRETNAAVTWIGRPKPKEADLTAREDRTENGKAGGILPWLHDFYVDRGLEKYQKKNPAALSKTLADVRARLSSEYARRAWFIENGLLFAGPGLIAGAAVFLLLGNWLLAGTMAYALVWAIFTPLHILPQRAPPQNIKAAGIIAAVNLLLLLPLLVAPYALPAVFLASFGVHWAVNARLRAEPRVRRMSEEEAKKLGKRAVGALGLVKRDYQFYSRHPVGTKYDTERFARPAPKGDGPMEMVRVGYLFFFEPAAFQRLSEDLQKDLARNVIFIPDLDHASRAGLELNLYAYTYTVITAMLDYDFAGKQVVDCGSGNGFLSLAALKLGATRAQLVDHDQKLLEQARNNLERNGYRAERQYHLVNADLARTYDVTSQLHLSGEPVVLISNIGTWDDYEVTNQDSMRLAAKLRRVAGFIGGGYEQTVGDWFYDQEILTQDHEKLAQLGFYPDPVLIMNQSDGPQQNATIAWVARPLPPVPDVTALPEYRIIKRKDPARAEHIRRVNGFAEAFYAGNFDYFLERMPRDASKEAKREYLDLLEKLQEEFRKLPMWQRYALSWETQLHDLGYADGGAIGHETRGAEIADRIMQDAGVPEHVRSLAARILAVHTELGWVRLGELRAERYRRHRGDIPLALLEVHNFMDLLGVGVFSLEQFEQIVEYDINEYYIGRKFDEYRLRHMAKPYMGAPSLSWDQNEKLQAMTDEILGKARRADEDKGTIDLRAVLKERADLTGGILFLTYALAAQDPTYRQYVRFMKFLALLAAQAPGGEAEIQCDVESLFPAMGRDQATAVAGKALAEALVSLPDDMDADDVREFCRRNDWVDLAPLAGGKPAMLWVTKLLEDGRGNSDLTGGDEKKPGDAERYRPGSSILKRNFRLDLLPGARRVWLLVLAGAAAVLGTLAPNRIQADKGATNADLNQAPLFGNLLREHFPESPALVEKFRPEQIELRLLTPRVGPWNYLRGLVWGYYAQPDDPLAKPVLYLPRYSAEALLLSVENAALSSKLRTAAAKRQLEMIVEHQSGRYYASTRLRLALSASWLPDGIQVLIHRRVRQARPAGYLAWVTEAAGAEASSTLAGALLTAGDELHESYLLAAKTGRQEEFAFKLVEALVALSQRSPRERTENLRFFQRIMARMKDVPAVAVAVGQDGETFLAPAALEGRQRTLGQLLDLLEQDPRFIVDRDRGPARKFQRRGVEHSFRGAS